MKDTNNINFFEDSPLDCVNEFNNFISNILKDNNSEKEELLIKYSKNNKTLKDIEGKIVLFENDICYDDNIFNPNKINEENEYMLKKLKINKNLILVKNSEIKNKLDILNRKINDIYEISDKIKSDNHREYVYNCKEGEKYKLEILKSQELERKRIARDLHDTVIQNLTNLIHKTELSIRVMDVDSIRAKLELMTMSKSIKEIIDEMRNIIYDLRPMAFDDIGIDVIIERELSDIKEKGIEVNYVVLGNRGNVDQIVLLTLLRIIQEACNNVVKHSKATKIEVKILYGEKYIEIYISDNGIGFDISNKKYISYESKSGFGLSMMKERVYMLSGKIDFKSIINEGTEIYVKVLKCFREEINDTNKFRNS